jgi:hypothetical protein
MRTIGFFFFAALVAGCGTGDGVVHETPDAAPPDAAPSSGEWVWQSDVPEAGELVAIWASNANDVWAGGDNGAMLHWNGSAWSAVDPGTTNHVSAIWGPGPSDVWATAGGLGGPNTANLVHWNGSTWTPVDAGTPMNLDGVWGSGPNDVYVVGASGVAGTIQHFDGKGWSNVWSSYATSPEGVFGSGASDVWVVGSDIYPTFGDHFLLHGATGGFSEVASGVTQYLARGWASGPNDAWAKGLGGLLHWDGASWTPVATPLGLGTGGVWGRASNDVYAVGGDQQIAHWDGATWTTVHADPVGAGLVAVGGADAAHAWAVGSHATILRFDTTVTGTPSCADVRGTCGDASACGVGQGHPSDYACSGASTCCVAETACGGVEADCCDSGGNPGPRAICHNGESYCPAGSQPCPQHP